MNKKQKIKNILCNEEFRGDICFLDYICKKGEGVEEILENIFNRYFKIK